MYQAAHRSAAPISGPVRALYWRTSEGWAVRCGIDMYIHNHIYIYHCMYCVIYIDICIVLYKYNIRIHHVYVWLYIYIYYIIYIQYMDNINHNYMWGKRPGFQAANSHHRSIFYGESTLVSRWNYWPIKTVQFFGQNISANWFSMISLIFRNMIGWLVGRKISMHLYFRTHGRLKQGYQSKVGFVWFT